jgi:hypothetical protein
MMGRQTVDQSQLFYLFNREKRIPERYLLRRITTLPRTSSAPTTTSLIETPGRFLLASVAAFVVLPSLLLVATHSTFIVALDISPVCLRIASVLIPLPFGFLAVPRGDSAFAPPLRLVSPPPRSAFPACLL